MSGAQVKTAGMRAAYCPCFDVSHLSLIGTQSLAVAANLTIEVPQLLCQLDSLMGAESFALIFPKLLL